MQSQQPTSEEFIASLLNHATEYAAGGLPVFPTHSPKRIGVCDCPAGEACENVGKHPRTIKGFKDASTDELSIRRWWKMWPRANVAIAVPSGYVVLDIDGDEGFDAIRTNDYIIPRTPTVSTGKGWHYWFTTTTDMAPRAHLLPKVDLRGPGSYVIAPPSLHATGRQYTWVARPDDTEFAAVPDWLVELAASPTSVSGEAAGHLDVAAVLAGVPEGKRDQELFRAASKLRYADVPYEMALALINQAAENCTPPFSHDQALKCLDSAYNRYKPSIQLDSGVGKVTIVGRDAVTVELEQAGGSPLEFAFSNMEKTGSNLDVELVVRSLMPGSSMDTYEQRLNVLSQSAREGARREMSNIFGIESKSLTILLNRAVQEAKRAFLAQPRAMRVSDIPAPKRIEYMVNDFLLDGRPNILFGTGGSLKTFVMMSVLLSVAAGRDWLGRPVQRRNVLLIDYETGRDMTGYRLNALAAGLGLEDGLPNIHWWDPDGIPLHELVDPLKRDIEALNIGFLGLDHAGAACGTEPEKAESALRFYRAMSRLHLPSVVLAHVNGNIADNPEQAKRPFGSIFWENGAGLTWFMMKQEQQEGANQVQVGVFQRKWNDSGRLPDFSVEFQFEDGEIFMDKAGLRDSAELRNTQGQQFPVWDALSQPATVAEIHDTTGLPEGRIRNLLNKYKAMFERVPGEAGGRGNKALWQRIDQADKTGSRNRFQAESQKPETGIETGSETGSLYINNKEPVSVRAPFEGALASEGEPEREPVSSDLPWWTGDSD